MFNVIYLGDDWGTITTAQKTRDFPVRIGRWMYRLISDLAHNRGIGPSFSFALLGAGVIFSGVICNHLFRFEDKLQKIVFMCCLALYPIWIEAYLFNMGHLPLAFALFAGSFSIYLFITEVLEREGSTVARRVICLLLSGVLLTITAASYQNYVFFPIMILFVWLALQLLERPLKTVLSWIAWSAVLGLFFAIAYVITVKLSIVLYEVPLAEGGRYSMTAVDKKNGIGKNLTSVAAFVFKYFTSEQQLIPLWTKLIYLYSWVFTGGLLLSQLINGRINKEEKGPFAVIVFVGLFLCFMLLPWSIGVLKGTASFRYNSMVPLALAFAFASAFPIAWLRAKNQVLSTVYVSVLAVVLLGFGFNNSHAIFTKSMSNNRDFNMTRQMISYMHASPEYDPNGEYELVVLGSPPFAKENLMFDLPTSDDQDWFRSMLNCGIWDCSMKRMIAAFRIHGETAEFSFRPKRRASRESIESQVSAEAFSKIRAWPNPGSVVISNDRKFVFVILEW